MLDALVIYAMLAIHSWGFWVGVVFGLFVSVLFSFPVLLALLTIPALGALGFYIQSLKK